MGDHGQGRKAEGLQFTINLITPDNGEKFIVELSNATLTNIEGFLAEGYRRIKVKIKPGKPLAFGRHGSKFVLGLPGNPVSSLVTFELFVRPVLRRLSGHADLVGRETLRATLADPVRKDPARRAFVRVRLPNGRAGYVSSRSVQLLDRPVDQRQ